MFRLILQALLSLTLVVLALPAQAASLSESAILDYVTNQVILRYQIPKQDVQVDWVDTRLDAILPTVPAGTLTFQVSEGVRLGGRGSVPVELLVNGTKYRTIFPRLEIKIFQKVLVAKNRIARGGQPMASDVALERRPITNTFEQPLTSFASLAGGEAIRDIPEGSVLTSGLFRVPPVVKMGEMVTVTVYSGGITIIASGEARANGIVGQAVKVLNPDSKTEFTARVVGPHQVEVKLED